MARREETLEMLAAGLGSAAVREQTASDHGILVRAARDGDRAAFGLLYERYARMVHGVLLAKVPLDVVDDLVQDVFIRALRRVSTLRETDSFGAWLATIARNLANDYHRRPTEEQLADDGDGIDISTEEPAFEKRAANAVLEAVRSLPDAYRETLLLRFVEGMTGPEIAARTGLTHGSVRVNLHRGLQLLRAKLGSQPASRRQEQEEESQ
jgi:RNA polymerase sigma-70 factor (ECF subfamily)